MKIKKIVVYFLDLIKIHKMDVFQPWHAIYLIKKQQKNRILKDELRSNVRNTPFSSLAPFCSSKMLV